MSDQLFEREMLIRCSNRGDFFPAKGIANVSLDANLDLISPEQAKTLLLEAYNHNRILPEVIGSLRIELMTVECEGEVYRIYNGNIIGELPCGSYGLIDYQGGQYT